MTQLALQTEQSGMPVHAAPAEAGTDIAASRAVGQACNMQQTDARRWLQQHARIAHKELQAMQLSLPAQA